MVTIRTYFYSNKKLSKWVYKLFLCREYDEKGLTSQTISCPNSISKQNIKQSNSKNGILANLKNM